jgi:hypothetical protein
MTRPALYALAALLLAGCGNHDGTSGTSEPLHASPPDAPTATSSGPAGTGRTCHPTRDVIVWTKTPGTTPAATLLGDPGGNCTSTIESVAATSPTGPGYCTIAAWATDNPGYNVDAPSPRRPKKPVEEIGGGC